MFTDEFLRVIIRDREREVQQRLRTRSLLAPIELSRRWLKRGRQLEHSQPTARGR